MGACAFGSLPPAVRRTVSGRIFLEHQGGPQAVPPSKGAAHAVDPLLDAAGAQGEAEAQPVCKERQPPAGLRSSNRTVSPRPLHLQRRPPPSRCPPPPA